MAEEGGEKLEIVSDKHKRRLSGRNRYFASKSRDIARNIKKAYGEKEKRDNVQLKSVPGRRKHDLIIRRAPSMIRDRRAPQIDLED